MDEKFVAQISEQFKLDKEIVEASYNDGTLGQRIADSVIKDKKVYAPDEFDQFKKNHAAEVTTSYFNDLVEKAKRGNLPQDLYTPIKGAAYEQLERELSKEFNVTEYSDVKDLIQKAVKSSANGKPNEEYERQIAELKRVNLELEEKAKNAPVDIEKKYKTLALEKERSNILNSVPFDFDGYKPDELDKAKERTQKLLKSVFDAEYSLDYTEDGKVVVKKGDDIIKNPATLDPVPASDVFNNLAKEYNLKLKSPDSGGQGGSSSATSKGLYSSVEEFEADMTAKGIKSTDPAYIEHYNKSGLRKSK